ncbi:hypothetical protein LPB260_27620 [Pseudomonas sp. LPB0260]|uniref:tetratricopeptide repeat protein n=1 Tax=Pseudomonas sp. LPB0260 TaxID=2614442 RepID=UPI0015C24FC3|nr:hypothetical protein [Pseudomonas sp. LPB0260]QLC74453.1 hypothetical protein LPB260_12670 [Pseudomonas sp. LPB0260]QLC77223.1 hypothetical protein LPB260_27620 [Pseudomonas sp. LPB0260]
MNIQLALPIAFALVVLGGCGSLGQQRTEANEDPHVQVDRVLAHYRATLASGVACQSATQGWSEPVDCEGLLRETMQLYANFPHNERVIMLAALMAYQSGRAPQAAYLLDQLLGGHKPRPEAAVLRSRIALEEGNLALARTLLKQQIRLNPRHPQLYETLAAVQYLDRQYAGALHSLSMSERVGAPGWRAAYHRGLIYEQQNRRDAACQQYRLAAAGNPQFLAPESRLVSLSGGAACGSPSATLGG